LNIHKDEEGNVKQASILNMLSPIKCEFVYNKYVSSGLDKSKDMDKQERFACESELSEDELLEEIKNILHSEVHKDKVIWSFDSHDDIIYTNSIKHFYDLKEFDDIVKFFDYSKNEELQYSADLNDSLFRNLFCIAFLFKNNHFVCN